MFAECISVSLTAHVLRGLVSILREMVQVSLIFHTQT